MRHLLSCLRDGCPRVVRSKPSSAWTSISLDVFRGQSLYDLGYVARSVGISRRREIVSFTHHRKVAFPSSPSIALQRPRQRESSSCRSGSSLNASTHIERRTGNGFESSSIPRPGLGSSPVEAHPGIRMTPSQPWRRRTKPLSTRQTSTRFACSTTTRLCSKGMCSTGLRTNESSRLTRCGSTLSSTTSSSGLRSSRPRRRGRGLPAARHRPGSSLFAVSRRPLVERGMTALS